jgi:hypothetical protein
MKTPKQKVGSQRLINEIQLARLKLAQAESKWAVADEQAREARCRRKEAKLAARRAKKLARQAKKEFTVAREAVVALEGKFAAAVELAVRNRKLARARLAAARRSAENISPAADLPADSKPAVKKGTPARKSLSVRSELVAAVAVPVASEEKSVPVRHDFEKPSPGPTRALSAVPLPLNSKPSTLNAEP